MEREKKSTAIENNIIPSISFKSLEIKKIEAPV
jgi:hypothetical protein